MHPRLFVGHASGNILQAAREIAVDLEYVKKRNHTSLIQISTRTEPAILDVQIYVDLSSEFYNILKRLKDTF